MSPLFNLSSFRCSSPVTFYACLSLSLFLWNFLSARLHSRTVVTLPKHRQGCLGPSQPPAPRPLIPLKLHWDARLTQFTQHSPNEGQLSKPLVLFHHTDIAVGSGGSYLCRCIPQAGSSCPLSFHFNNACSSGSQARAIWESQPPLRGRCTNTSIVPPAKSLPLVVTPLCDTAAATQLCTNTTWHKLMPVPATTHARKQHGTGEHTLIKDPCVLFLRR